jgi:predicted permease
MTGWGQDVRYAVRRLAKSPGFTAAAVVSIALGIAANSTIFSMVSRFVLRPPPVGDPSTLLTLHTSERGECCNHFTWPLFEDLRHQAKSFSGVAAYDEMIPAAIQGQGGGGSGEPERVWGQGTTSDFFDVAQMRMTVGRGFAAGEERLPVVVLGYDLWRRRFGADPAIGGKPVTLSGRPFTVVGVAPRAFHGLDQILYTQFWVPMNSVDQLVPHTGNYESRNVAWVSVMARLRRGVTREQAAAELSVIAQREAQAHPEAEKDRGFRFEQAGSPGPNERPLTMFLAALSVVVLLVLCIAAANVVNLLLAQASGRQREMAIRRAVGATRGQLMRQMLTETLLIALGGGVAGAVFSLWATSGLSSLSLPAPVPLDLAIGMDWRTILYTFALSVGTGLLLGLAPAAAVMRPVLMNALKGEDTLAPPGRRWTLRNVLVVSQIAMSLVLLCGTGLFLRSLQAAAGMDLGLHAKGVVMMSVDPRLDGYTAEQTTRFLSDLQERVAALPGVSATACTDVVPLSMGNRSDGMSVEGRPAAATPDSVDLYMATPGYLNTLGIPLVSGRDFGNENAASRRVAIVNEELARELFPHENPNGRLITGGGVSYQVIGVVKNIKSRTVGEEVRPVLFRSLAQTVSSDPSVLGYSVLARGAGETGALASAMRREIRSLDPTLAIFNAQTMDEHFEAALFLPKLMGTLFAVFGGAGLLLAAVGLYGVMSYSISRRTSEIGIRMALGSTESAVRSLVIRQGMVLTSIAMALGLAAAWATAKLSTSVLYGVQPHDMATFTVVPVFLCFVALVACWIPARRAAAVDPMVALRHQ